MVYHKCSVNLFSWLPWRFCSCSSLFRGKLKATPLLAADSHWSLLPGCQYLMSNCWCLCQRCYFLSLLKLLAPRLSIFYTLLPPHTCVSLNGRMFSQFAKSGNNILSWVSAFIFYEYCEHATDFSFGGLASRKALS